MTETSGSKAPPSNTCPNCHGPLSYTASVCPHCNHRIRKTSLLFVVLGIIVVAFLIRIAYSTYSRPPAPPPQTQEQRDKAAAVQRETAERQRIADLAAKEQQRKADEAFLKTKAGKIWNNHQSWSRDVCETIAKKQIQIGMSSEQVEASWGKPDHINTTQTASHTSEQWVYSGGNSYVYFDDGVMTSLQQTKH